MNRFNGSSGGTRGRGADYAHYWDHAGGVPSISGRIGWHVTWAIAIDDQSERLSFYETFAEDADFHPLFRGPLPRRVREIAEACGASYEGVLQSDDPLWAVLYREDPLLLGEYGEGSWYDDQPIEDILPPE